MPTISVAYAQHFNVKDRCDTRQQLQLPSIYCAYARKAGLAWKYFLIFAYATDVLFLNNYNSKAWPTAALGPPGSVNREVDPAGAQGHLG